MGLDEVRAFLLDLAERRKVAEATQHQYVAAIKFLYATTLGRPEVAVAIPWPKVPQKLPPVLSGTEVEALLNAIGSVKQRTIVLTAYGAGLRIDETRGDKTVTLSAEEFLRRFLLHVLPHRFVKIRHFGLMAACHATTTLEVARTRILAARDAGQRAVGGDEHREGSSHERWNHARR